MWPALNFGRYLEENFPRIRVYCHATTRSPIGIGDGENYPLNSGYLLPSLYDLGRQTYLYNLTDYDRVYVLTDAHTVYGRAELSAALTATGGKNIGFWEI